MNNNNHKSKFLVFAFLAVAVIFSMLLASAAQPTVNLGTAGNFAILSKAGISTTGTTSIVGNIGVSPIGYAGITGFALIGVPANDAFLTSTLVTGNIYAADLFAPTPNIMTTAVSDMETAYTDAAGRTHTLIATNTDLGAGDISGMTITPGVTDGLYKWGTGLLIDNRGVTISGTATDVFIFQIAQDLTVADGAKVTLTGGVLPQNVFWQVAGQATLGTTSQFKGIILSQTAIALNTGATLHGRALAQTAVTLDSNAISSPDGIAPILVLPIHVENAPSTQVLTMNGGTLLPGGDLFTPVLGSTLLINTDAYYGTHTKTLTGNFPNVHWKITVERTDGTPLTDSSNVAITEKGWFDATSGAVEDSNYVFSVINGKLVGVGNNWGTVAIDNFTNVDLIHFNANAALGDYIITRELVTNTDLVISNSYIMPLTLTTPTVTSTTTTSSGSGGGAGGCVTQWTCSEWVTDANGKQTRTCTYAPNMCKPVSIKPIESQAGTIPVATTPTTNPPIALGPSITGGVTGVVDQIKGMAVGAWVIIALIATAVGASIVLLIKAARK